MRRKVAFLLQGGECGCRHSRPSLANICRLISRSLPDALWPFSLPCRAWTAGFTACRFGRSMRPATPATRRWPILSRWVGSAVCHAMGCSPRVPP